MSTQTRLPVGTRKTPETSQHAVTPGSVQLDRVLHACDTTRALQALGLTYLHLSTVDSHTAAPVTFVHWGKLFPVWAGPKSTRTQHTPALLQSATASQGTPRAASALSVASGVAFASAITDASGVEITSTLASLVTVLAASSDGVPVEVVVLEEQASTRADPTITKNRQALMRFMLPTSPSSDAHVKCKAMCTR